MRLSDSFTMCTSHLEKISYLFKSNRPFYHLFLDHQALIIETIGAKLSHFNQEPKTTWKTHSIQDIILYHMTSFLIQGHVLPSTISKLNFIQEWVNLEEKKDWEMESVFKLEMEGLYL